MKRQRYCGKDELLDLLKLGVFSSECEVIAEKTPEKDWHRKLKTIQTYSMRMFEERLAALDPKQALTVKRRYEHTAIKFYTSDQNRLKCKDDDKPESHFNISHSDFFDVLDLAAMNCKCCPQGKQCLEECYYRDLYHRLGVPVNKDNPAEGECEFGYYPVGEMDVPKHFTLKIQEERERI